MEIKILHRNASGYISEGPHDRPKPVRNPDPKLHPFSAAREYRRALTATKLNKIFAKPLVSVLEGHTDSVNCMCTSRSVLCDLFTGSCNGEIRMWNMLKDYGRTIGLHTGFVNGLCTNRDGTMLYSCGNDKYIKCWNVLSVISINGKDVDSMTVEDLNNDLATSPHSFKQAVEPAKIFISNSILNSIDHHWSKDLIASAGDSLEIWDGQRSMPMMKFEWGCDSLYYVKFNASDVNLLASTAADNSVGLYDIRANSPIRKVILRLKSNSLCWNPRNPLNFTIANEDSNLYTFDMRNLQKALLVHKDFTNAVTDLDYSPTGKEFVASSFDKCIRLFPLEGRSRDVYSNRRMQNVLCCRFSLDGRFVCSGSSDMCVRIWKSEASAPIGPRSARESASLAYRNALMDKYKGLPEIRRIQNHHHVPALILKNKKQLQEKAAAKRRREINSVLHSKDGTIAQEKEKPILNQLE